MITKKQTKRDAESLFKILRKDKHTNARLGVLSTPHGKIKTPSYVIVATHAQVKCLKPSDIKKTKTQVVIANTYHLWDKDVAKYSALNAKQSFLIKKLGMIMPTMTDSGGFQVFSLGFGKKNKVGKVLRPVDNRLAMSVIHRRENIKITKNGVYFMLDDKKKFLGPELSMKIQEKLGADIIFAFDECTSPLDSYAYNKKALERTHRWAKICLEQIAKRSALSARQLLFGIVQGGKFKRLRVKSAKFVASLPFDGIGIGGSFGKDEMIKTLEWIIPHLPEEKPRHLLGIGRVKDIFNAVEQGIDLFDCVIPTREARHGRIYTRYGTYDISKNHKLTKTLDRSCKCPVCKTGLSRGELRTMFKGTDKGGYNPAPSKEKQKAQRLATIHNVWFFNNLMEKIRKSIAKDELKEFKSRFLNRFRQP